ncbi:hypothetical protein EJ04DRAFT_507636 [Polyplosphaeria fusca]|uniref:Uncharacterized protein n=1 Tax=Polyplosphaeria fusca TaxID=682080 RepID=A0A9P4RC65_9PLEO|nr:hypothetical protein EJ04DRAFT_507636 [Polyplosphaeria fusca]
MSPAATQARSFLAFPREIRDRIYGFLLEGSSFTFNDTVVDDHRLNFKVVYGAGNEGGETRLPLWLISCKQTLHEGLEEFYRGARCLGYGRCWCTGCSRRPRSRCHDYPGKLLSLDLIRNLDYTDNKIDPSSPCCHDFWRSVKDDKRSNRITIVPINGERDKGNSPNCDYLVDYLISTPQHSVRQIKFSLELPSLPDGLQRSVVQHSWAVDMSYFLKLGCRFDRVVFRIACPAWYLTGGLEQQRMNTIMYPKFQEEAVRVGKLLVGAAEGNTWGYVVRDYFESIPKLVRASVDKFIQDGFIQDGLEWHVEITRHTVKRQGSIEHPGLQYWKKMRPATMSPLYDYFVPGEAEEEGSFSWRCPKTQETVSLSLPMPLERTNS